MRKRPLFILPGATARDRAVACLGAAVAIGLTGLIAAWLHGDGEALEHGALACGLAVGLAIAVTSKASSGG